MKGSSWIRFVLLFSILVSITLQTGVFSSIRLGHAVTIGPVPWTPAGPSSDDLAIWPFADSASECVALASASPSIDAMDVPDGCGACSSGSANYFLTASNYCYSSAWQGVVDSTVPATGTFNFFTTLNAHNLLSSTFREGLSAPTTGLNPYTATANPQNSFVLHSVYDQLYRASPESNPASPDLFGWMSASLITLPNNQLGYPPQSPPPPDTTITIRNTLWNDLYWQDGHRVDARDVAFTYLSLIAQNAPQNPPEMMCGGGSTTCLVTGVTLMNCNNTSPDAGPCTQFDINLKGFGSSSEEAVEQDIGSVTILPAHVWSSCASTWYAPIGSDIPALKLSSIAVFPLASVGPACGGPDSYLQANPTLMGQDPIASSLFIGSGPWKCGLPPTLGTGCSSTNTTTPPVGGSFLLTRFGKGLQPGGAPPFQVYFRSGGTLALHLWVETGWPTATLMLSRLYSNFGLPVGTPGGTHWQEGIGGGGPGGPHAIGASQVSIGLRFYNFNWVYPYDWANSPPSGIVSSHPVIFEGSIILDPASIAGCALVANGTPTVSAYPNGGGYDC